MTRCYICEDVITKKNRTLEHIILNSIGGNLKSKKLICKRCNSGFGNQLDSELSRQLNHIANLLNIERNRGNPQPIIGKNESNNEKWLLKSGGKPYKGKPDFKEVIDEKGQKIISVQARCTKEAKKMIKGLAKKYPQIDEDKVMQNAINSSEYLENKIHFTSSIGGQKSFRSICKTAVNYYIYNGGSKKLIFHLIPFIRDGIDKNIVWFFYNGIEIIEKESDQVIHSIILIGDPKEKILYAYVEFFNTFKFIVLLNDNYNEEVINKIYIYDVLKCAEISKEVHIKLKKENIINILNKKPRPEANLKKHYNKILQIIMKKMNNDHINEMIVKTFNNSLMKHPEGIPINEKMADELTNEFMKEITPWLIHIFKKGNNEM